MTKLLITEITRMGPAFCVIGLQHEQQSFNQSGPFLQRLTVGGSFLINVAKFWSVHSHRLLGRPHMLKTGC
jgi:hypothetical protein